MALVQLINDIKTMKIQGATNVALESLKYLKKTKLKNFSKVARQLENTRPTAVVLHNCLEQIRKDKDIKTVTRLLRELKTARVRLAEKSSVLIKKNYKIMTHCHSGDALAGIKHAWDQGKKITVYATETEPRHQGIVTAKELHKYGIQTVIIEDPASAYFMKDMDCVILSADALRKEGVYNKIGTYGLAIIAKKLKIPFYVFATSFKIDNRKNIEIEERPAKEVYTKLNELKGIDIRNPSFDLTPWNLVTRIVTEKGVMTPGNIKRLLK